MLPVRSLPLTRGNLHSYDGPERAVECVDFDDDLERVNARSHSSRLKCELNAIAAAAKLIDPMTIYQLNHLEISSFFLLQIRRLR